MGPQVNTPQVNRWAFPKVGQQMTAQTASKMRANPQLYTEPAKSKKHYCTIDLHAEDSKPGTTAAYRLKANFPRKETRSNRTGCDHRAIIIIDLCGGADATCRCLYCNDLLLVMRHRVEQA